MINQYYVLYFVINIKYFDYWQMTDINGLISFH